MGHLSFGVPFHQAVFPILMTKPEGFVKKAAAQATDDEDAEINSHPN